MKSRGLFFAFLLLLGAQRLAELRLSARNERGMLAAGGREHAHHQWTIMRLLHISWFLSMLVEVFTLKRRFSPLPGSLAAIVFVLGQALRYTAIRTLGPLWTVRVYTLPGSEPVTGGIYRSMRHPNYLGVMLEIAAVPLLHNAWLTALVFSILNGLLLMWRIRAEEQALSDAGAYHQAIENRPRFIPRIHGNAD